MKAIVKIRIQDDIDDGAGAVVAERLRLLGFGEVKKARVGKLIELELEAGDRQNAEHRVRQMCERMLANPRIEEFEVDSVE